MTKEENKEESPEIKAINKAHKDFTEKIKSLKAEILKNKESTKITEELFKNITEQLNELEKNLNHKDEPLLTNFKNTAIKIREAGQYTKTAIKDMEKNLQENLSNQIETKKIAKQLKELNYLASIHNSLEIFLKDSIDPLFSKPKSTKGPSEKYLEKKEELEKKNHPTQKKSFIGKKGSAEAELLDEKINTEYKKSEKTEYNENIAEKKAEFLGKFKKESSNFKSLNYHLLSVNDKTELINLMLEQHTNKNKLEEISNDILQNLSLKKINIKNIPQLFTLLIFDEASYVYTDASEKKQRPIISMISNIETEHDRILLLSNLDNIINYFKDKTNSTKSMFIKTIQHIKSNIELFSIDAKTDIHKKNNSRKNIYKIITDIEDRNFKDFLQLKENTEKKGLIYGIKNLFNTINIFNKGNKQEENKEIFYDIEPEETTNKKNKTENKKIETDYYMKKEEQQQKEIKENKIQQEKEKNENYQKNLKRNEELGRKKQ